MANPIYNGACKYTVCFTEYIIVDVINISFNAFGDNTAVHVIRFSPFSSLRILSKLVKYTCPYYHQKFKTIQ